MPIIKLCLLPEDLYLMKSKNNIPLIHRIPLTRIKLAIAKLLYLIVKIVLRNNHRVITRNGIRFKIDLSEGIDLSLFLFGNFQSYITTSRLFSLAGDAVIFDIGANIGSMSLAFAKLSPDGQVYAFEPTSYAFGKLEENLSLNPSLAEHIKATQMFASEKTATDHNIEAYSSWKIDGSAESAHPLHGGTLKTDREKNIPAISLDDFCDENRIQRLDCIKIDTDGHELKVLKGANRTIRQFQPVIIFEIGLYIIQEHGIKFEEYFEFFTGCGYTLFNSKNNKPVTPKNYLRQIPQYYTTDIVAIPT